MDSWHQEESYVTAGQYMKTGELIGKIGDTPRLSGAHLYWELWVNGIQVIRRLADSDLPLG